jgi:peptidoglycan lytic transglycosylase
LPKRIDPLLSNFRHRHDGTQQHVFASVGLLHSRPFSLLKNITTFGLTLLIAGTTGLPINLNTVSADTLTAAGKAPAMPAEEAAFRKAMDQALKPLISYPLAKQDGKTVKSAFAAVDKRKPQTADELKAKLSDPTARALITWYKLKRGYGTATEYATFLDTHPNWPQSTLLQQRLEEALFIQGGSASAIIQRFKKEPPATATGQAALASAYLALGEKDKAKELAAKSWRQGDIPSTLETGFLQRFRDLLTNEDHKWRLDRLLIDDFRWKSARKSRAATIRRVIPLLDAKERKRAKTRLGVFLRGRSSYKRVVKYKRQAKVGTGTDWGLVFQQVQAHRQLKQYDKAAKLLLSAPTETSQSVNPDGWWKERRANAYAALKRGKPKLAYQLVRDSGPLSVNPLNEQRFLAAWLALSKLKEPKLAKAHLAAMTQSADGPKSRARSNYWLGRTLDKLGETDAAKKAYAQATKDPDAFHAMLAQIRLDPTPKPITITPPDMPDATTIKKFTTLEQARALAIADKAGLSRDVTRLFIVRLRNVHESEAELAMVAHFADAIGDTQMALRNAKAAIARRKNLYYYAYPIHTFPDYEPLRAPPEWAFLLGIVRQETEFNTSIVSGAGAKGLMQVMTITAKHICQDYKIRCRIDQLLKDEAYNARIGSAYLGDRMRDFKGSYVLTLSGYNAGPGRTRQWIKQFGDPRNPDMDPLDWIERIPFQETRAYVGKVLANIQIYRARLGQQPALRLADDLKRGQFSKSKTASQGKPSKQRAQN